MADEVDGPLDAAWVARKHAADDELTTADGALWWIQSDPDLGGDRRVVRQVAGGLAEARTPADLPVGGWLHAYGGGSYAVGGDSVWIVNARNSKVYRIRPGTQPERVVPEDDGFLYGDLRFSDGALLAVRGTEDGDEIVRITRDGSGPEVLATSPGFLAAPRAHGGLLAYLEWDADRMPWDASRLYVAEQGADGGLGATKLIAGGEEESVVQPAWGPDGSLYFLSDRSGWWNLYRWDGSVHPVAPMDADCAPAPWEGGYQSYAFLPGGGIALTVHDGFRTGLITVGPDGRCTRHETGLTSMKPYVAVLGEQLAVIGSTPQSAPSVRLVTLGGPESTAVAKTAPDWSVRMSIPAIRVVERSGKTVRHLLYLPSSRSTLPAPLLVRAHPGPTGDVPLRLDWTVQYFTSRGFAVADVAYRGSTGHGRAFRQALYGHWGEYDVEDCTVVAEDLLVAGVARPGAVFITGASAGGYTALQAACRPGPFTAATATSAITDPARWTRTAPRFQRPHAAALSGPAGAVKAEAISAPVLLIHGTTDDIAPVRDVLQLVDRLAHRGADLERLILDGVGHYLSSPAAMTRALEAELAFYRRFMAEAQ